MSDEQATEEITPPATETEARNEARQAARLSREAPQPDDPYAAERTTKQWYVIHTYSGYENKVKTNLEHRIESMGVEDQIFQVLVPMEEEVEIKNGQRRTVNKKVFPGYVLVEMVMTDESWYVVRNTPGVTSFVGSGNRPTPLEESEVRKILKQMGVEAPQVQDRSSPRARASASRTARSPSSSAPSTRSTRRRTRSRCWSASSAARRRSSSTSCRVGEGC